VAKEILDRRRCLADYFAGGEPRKRRGPRTLLSDQEILARREEWAKVFEGLWGEIGWELKRCKKETDILRALSPLNQIHFIRDLASVFFYESKEPVSAATVRKVRAKLVSVQLRCLDVEVSKQQALEELERMNAAITQAPPSMLRLIKLARKRQRKEAARALREWRELSRLQKELLARLKGLEAGFARQEVLRFCKEKRYELSPLNLANAVAGLPYMGWRRSMGRTIKYPSMFGNGLEYQIFKVIRFIAENAKRHSENVFIAEFRERIPGLPNRYRAARDEIAERWFYLERALRQALRNKPRPRAIPFEITKHYFRQFRSPRSQVEIIVAQNAKLRLPKQNQSRGKNRGDDLSLDKIDQ
jgi:hypothetical protein